MCSSLSNFTILVNLYFVEKKLPNLPQGVVKRKRKRKSIQRPSVQVPFLVEPIQQLTIKLTSLHFIPLVSVFLQQNHNPPSVQTPPPPLCYVNFLQVPRSPGTNFHP